MPPKIETSKALTEWRLARKLSQPELADCIGVAKSTVYRWECGDRRIPRYLSALLHGLKVSRAR